MSQFEDMRAYTKGREVYLAHGNAVWEALKAVTNIPYDKDAHMLAKPARIVCHSKKDTQNF